MNDDTILGTLRDSLEFLELDEDACADGLYFRHWPDLEAELFASDAALLPQAIRRAGR